MKRYRLLALLVFCPSFAFAQGGLVDYQSDILSSTLVSTNPGFEDGDLTDWDTSYQAPFSVTDAEAHTGTYSATITGAVYTPFLFKTVSVTGGKYYRLSGWLKGQDVTSNGYRIRVEDEADCAYACASSAVYSGTFNWRYVELKNIYVKEDGTVNIGFQDHGRITGTMWLDDLEFVEEEAQPIDAKLIFPSYRGILWSDMTQQAVFRVTNNDGGTIESVKTNDSAPGSPIVAGETIDGDGNITIAVTEDCYIAFRIQGESTPDYPNYRIEKRAATQRQTWPISWTDDNRFRVNDAPTFFIAVYDSGLDAKEPESWYDLRLGDYRRLDELSGDVNGYLHYWWGRQPVAYMQAMMDWLNTNDLGLYWQTANCFAANAWQTEYWPAVTDQTYAEGLATHAGYAGNYIMDECVSGTAADMFPEISQAWPWAPKTANLVVANKPAALNFWYDVGDILAADPYPLSLAEPAEGYPLNRVGNWASQVKAAVYDSRPFMMVLEYFEGQGTGRWPTQAELRNMSYMAIVEGAQGLWYWSLGVNALAYTCTPSTSWCAAKIDYYDRLKNVVSELRDNEAIFLMADDSARLVASNNSNIRTLVKDGYVLAYNDTYEVQEVTFTWDEIVSAVAVVSESRSITPSSTQFSDTFESYEAHVYQITDGGVPPDPELDIVDKLRGQASSTSVRVTWGDADLTWGVSCAAALKDSEGSTLDTNTLTTGFATRNTGFDGLTAATQYVVVVSCTDYEDATYSFTTLAAVTGTVSYSVALFPNEILTTAAKAQVDYRLPGAGTSSVTDEDCGSGCSVSLTLTRGVLYEIRHHWLDASDNTLASTDWRNLTVD